MGTGSESWDKVDFRYPEEVPTMISGEERRYLYWLGSSFWQGKGHIVEMGPWLGGSTICLASGMRRSGKNGSQSLHVYDSFVWREFMAERCPLALRVGESFQTFFEKNVQDYRDILTVTRALLPDETVASDSSAAALRQDPAGVTQSVSWNYNQPVEILFVDGAKSWSGFRELLHVFGRHMIVGESLLVLQDFKYWGSFWVAAITEILSKCLRLEHVLRQNTVAFRVVAPLNDETLAKIPEWDDLTGDEGARLVESAARRLDEVGDRIGAAVVRLSCVRMWVHKGNEAYALEALRRSERRWPLLGVDGNLEAVRAWLQTETGTELPSLWRTRLRKQYFRLRNTLRFLAHRFRIGVK